MNDVLLVNATIGFSGNLFLVLKECWNRSGECSSNMTSRLISMSMNTLHQLLVRLKDKILEGMSSGTSIPYSM